jgi:hypothetical protein
VQEQEEGAEQTSKCQIVPGWSKKVTAIAGNFYSLVYQHIIDF